MKYYYIISVEAMQEFFRDIINVHGCQIHPDDFFADMVNEEVGPTFETDVACYMDQVMTQCFIYCDEHDMDIYEIAGEVQVSEYKKLGLLPHDFGTDARED